MADFKIIEFNAKVVKGLGRGRILGFPTANLDAENIGLSHGIYLVGIEVLGQEYEGLMFYGPKPTFNEPVSLEVLIKGLAGDIYGESVAVRVVKKIREVKKFSSPQELQKQIRADIEENLF